MKRTYLNNAATSWPKAPGVAEAVRKAVDSLPADPGRVAGGAEDVAAECRRRLATMIGARHPDRIALTLNGTHSLNLAISGLPFENGDVVMTTVTEHNSVLRPLRRLADTGRILLRVVGATRDGALDEDDYEQGLKFYPRLVVVNHASNVTGRVLDAPRLLARARHFGALTLLDASQSLGCVPISVDGAGADMIAFTGHKALLGPDGCGGLYVSPQVDLEPLWVGGTGVRSDLEAQPKEMPVRLESGTPNTVGLAGWATALSWLESHGASHREARNRAAVRLAEGLRSIPGVRIFARQGAAPLTGVISLQMDGWTAEEAGFALRESFGIVCRTGLHCAPLIHQAIGSGPEGTLRLSVSGFTTDADVNDCLCAMRKMTECRS